MIIAVATKAGVEREEARATVDRGQGTVAEEELQRRDARLFGKGFVGFPLGKARIWRE